MRLFRSLIALCRHTPGRGGQRACVAAGQGTSVCWGGGGSADNDKGKDDARTSPLLFLSQDPLPPPHTHTHTLAPLRKRWPDRRSPED